jgi:putative thioredoxin
LSNPSFQGAVDLSSLVNKQTKEPELVTVPAIVIELAQPGFRAVVELSNVVPVLICFYDEAKQDSVDLTNKLEKLVLEADGKLFLGKVNIQAQPELARAFNITSAASVVLLLSGDPRPLFQGDQSEADLTSFLNKLLEVANQQGLNGQLTIGDPLEAAEEQLTPAEQAAFDAMENGDFDTAVAIYEKELKEKPNNDALIERLAQTKLVQRTYNQDFEKQLALSPETAEEAITKADFIMATGNSEAAFELLLSFFDKANPDQKKALIAALLELFNVVGKAHPSVVEARKQLAVRMF